MANATNTLAAILNLGDANVDFEVSDLLQAVPVVNRLTAIASTHGHTHKYIKEETAASSGFRAINAGISNTAGEVTLITETLKFLDASWEDDIAIAKSMSSRKGGMDAWVSDRTRRSLAAAFVGLEKQLIYGDQAPGNTSGFTGLIDGIDSEMILDAEGSTAGEQTSVYAIRTGPQDVAAIYNGDNSGLIEVSEVYKVRKVDGSSDPYTALRCDIDGYLGYQIGNKYAAARLANLHASDSGAQLNDDDLAELLSLFPAAQMPSFFAMTRQSLKQLQQSRTATNPTGNPAPFPSEAFGIPIIVTDQIVNTEAVVS
jgi:hypothetical protein